MDTILLFALSAAGLWIGITGIIKARSAAGVVIAVMAILAAVALFVVASLSGALPS